MEHDLQELHASIEVLVTNRKGVQIPVVCVVLWCMSGVCSDLISSSVKLDVIMSFILHFCELNKSTKLNDTNMLIISINYWQ